MLMMMKAAAAVVVEGMRYYMAEHPTVVGFRWSHSQSWGSTWYFLFSAILGYVSASVALHLILLLLRGRRPVPLGPVPALHSLVLALLSAAVFVGLVMSAAAEIRDTRWFWRPRSKTPLQWLLCFPLGTRPSGRVFFWSYVFYLSRFLLLLRSFFSILGRRPLTLYRLLHHPILLCMSFLWLEFSQSFQVLAILCSTSVYSVVYAYRFWVALGLPAGCFPVILNCQCLLLASNLFCHLGVLLLHFSKGGCNGIGAWFFNSLLNAALMLLFLNSRVQNLHFAPCKKQALVDSLE